MTSAVMNAPARPATEDFGSIHTLQSSSASPDEFQVRDNADPAGLSAILAEPGSLTLLWVVQIALRDGQIELGKQNVEQRHQTVEALFAKIKEAMREAQEAAKNKGLFGELFDKFGVVAQIAVAIAAVASVIGTGGGSLIAIAALAGTLLSMGAKPLAEALGGGKTLTDVFQYTGMGISLLAGGAGLLQGLGVFGAQATTQGASLLKDVCRGISIAASGVQAGATGAQGVTGYVRDSYGADELEARADEQDGRTTRAGEFREIERALEFLKQVDKSFSASRATLEETMNLEAQSDLNLVNLGVRA